MAFVLRLLGGFRLVREDGEPVHLPERARALLACLAVASSPVPRPVLTGLLFETGDEQEQRAALRQAVYVARKATAEDALRATADGDLILDDTLVQVDVRLFRNAISGCPSPALRDAVELYRGPFLDGAKSPSAAFEDWLQARRAEFQEQALDCLLELAAADAASGLHASALAYARRALSLDPLREDAHRQVMSVLAALGQRANALRQYGLARQLLADELGVEPEDDTRALCESIARGAERREAASLPPIASGGVPEVPHPPPRHFARIARLGGFRKAMVALTVTFPVLIGTAAWYAHQEPANSLPAIAVLPFTSFEGGPAQDFGIEQEITTMLSTHPGLRVVSRRRSSAYVAPNAKRPYDGLGAKYVLEGSVQKTAGALQVRVQLIDAGTGNHLWANRLQEQGNDPAEARERIAYGIYESLVGFTGEIERHEQRDAWRRSAPGEFDYAARGEHFLFQFTEEAHAKARQIWQEGLAKYPDSAVIRVGLAAAYRHAVEVGWSKQPERDLEEAWQLAHQASLLAHGSRYEQWLSHWMMAKLAQWCRNDFARSLLEAKAAAKLVPFDATSRADLAELLANAGRTREAIEWLQESIRRDPQGPEWYRGNLAWAYYLSGRYEEALAELGKLSKPRHLVLAAVYVRLGRLPQARAAIADFIMENPGRTLSDAARWPLIASLERGWLADLRLAGLPGG